jgi:hypothetical protein
MFNLSWVKIKEPRAVALLHGWSQEIPHFELQEFYGNSQSMILDWLFPQSLLISENFRRKNFLH